MAKKPKEKTIFKVVLETDPNLKFQEVLFLHAGHFVIEGEFALFYEDRDEELDCSCVAAIKNWIRVSKETKESIKEELEAQLIQLELMEKRKAEI